jgi:hypothetical protein
MSTSDINSSASQRVQYAEEPLRLLVESVEHGFIGSICAPSYEQFFAETD